MTSYAASARFGVDRAADLLLPADRRGRNTLRAALAWAVDAHEGDVGKMRERLDKLAANDPARLVDLVTVLGGLVDIEQTPSQLLGWMCPPGQKPKPRPNEAYCGTVRGHMDHVDAGEDPCRPCQAAFDRDTVPLRRRGPAKCGTPRGWRSHKHRKEEPCDLCWEAIRAYWSGRYQDRHVKVVDRTTRIKDCPSRAGYYRHKRRGEDPCPGCIAESRRYDRERMRERYKPRPRQLKGCNTVASRRRHTRRRERCDTCWPPSLGYTPAWYPPQEAEQVRQLRLLQAS